MYSLLMILNGYLLSSFNDSRTLKMVQQDILVVFKWSVGDFLFPYNCKKLVEAEFISA